MKSGGGDRELHTHPVMTRFFAGVADGVAGLNAALAGNGAGAGENCLKKRGLTALERTYNRDAAGARGTPPISSQLVAMTTSRTQSWPHPPFARAAKAKAGRTYGFRGWRVSKGAGIPVPGLAQPNSPTPAATFNPVWPWTDSGWSATGAFDAPIRTLAPRPTATLASAVAPT